MKTIAHLSLACLFCLLPAVELQAGLVPLSFRRLPQITVAPRMKIYRTMARNKFTGRTQCVYTGPSRELAKRTEAFYDRLAGWNAWVDADKF